MSGRTQPVSRWMWTSDVHPNQFVAALRDVRLPAAVSQGRVRIFADTKYKLYVNGQFVNSGPAPFRKPVVPVDAYDVTPYLVKGRNTIFIVAHFIGTTVKYNSVDKPGIWVDVDVRMAGGRRLRVVSDDTWRVAGLACWNAAAPRRNWALEHMEDVNLAHPSFRILARYAGADYTGGQARPESAGLWKKPSLHNRSDLILRDRPVAPLCWVREEGFRPALFLTNTEVYNLQDTAVRLDHEHIRPVWDEQAYEMTREGGVRFDRRGGEAGVSLCYDFRRVCAGEASAEIHCETPCTVDIAMAEAVRADGHPIVWRNGGLFYARYHLVAGVNRVRFYHFNGYRYLYLVFKDAIGMVDVRSVASHHCRAALEFTDTFACEDRVAGSLYRISRRSLMLNAQANLYDCNTREQGTYWGDAIWVADTIGHQTGDFRHMRALCLAMTDEFKACGPLLPSSLYGDRRPLYDYCLVPVELLWRYYRYTGDLTLIKDHLPTARAIVEAFRGFRDDNGLLAVRNIPAGEGDGGKGLLFLDHPGNGWHPMTTTGIDRSDYSAGFNLFFLQALQALEGMERACGRKSSGAREISERVLLLRNRFFIASQGLVADSSSPVGTRPPRFSQIANALAITTGVLEGAVARDALTQVLDLPRHPWVSQGTPYSYFFLADAAARTEQADTAVRAFCRDFTPMLSRGATTTWEAWNADNHDSLNHAWSAPFPFLVRVAVMGLGPAKPGYAETVLAPQCSVFDRFAGSCRIPQGEVSMAWTRVGPDAWELQVQLPKGNRGILTLPGGTQRFTGRWQGMVSGHGSPVKGDGDA